MATAPDDLFGYGDPQGLLELRRALATYVGRARGVVTDASRIVVFGGVASAVGVLAETFNSLSITRVAVEDPGMPFHRAILQQLGITTVPVPVDAGGLRVDRLAASDVGAVIVSPAHQYPLGVTLAPDRRTALVAWARNATGGSSRTTTTASSATTASRSGQFRGSTPSASSTPARRASRSHRAFELPGSRSRDG